MPHVWGYLKTPEGGTGSSVAGITGGYELPDVDAGNLT